MVSTSGCGRNMGKPAACDYLQSLCVFILINNSRIDSADGHAHALRWQQIAGRLCWIWRLKSIRASHASILEHACSVSDLFVASCEANVVVSLGIVFLLGETS